jgi:hypothetical protein
MKFEICTPLVSITIQFNHLKNRDIWLEKTKHLEWIKNAYNLPNDYERIIESEKPGELDYVPF